MDWNNAGVFLLEQIVTAVFGMAVIAGAAYAALRMRDSKIPALVRAAPYVEMAGQVAYDALSAATRHPGVPDYAAARALALTEGKAALATLAPNLTASDVDLGAKAGLGIALQRDPSFSPASNLQPVAVAAVPVVADSRGSVVGDAPRLVKPTLAVMTASTDVGKAVTQ